ncbi:MAG TPA: LacI family DNA-binding transcriptional regulator [Phototrophicaceae bacterium]|jgi:LacI family transcriptional regulator|nr:LacI family DNA-binding transcriptional regulator [Phototrophicaceae bacterium]
MANGDTKRNRHLNLNDIAKRAGVSRSTVSRVLNDDGYVSDETRQSVQAIIDELGYTPNMGARMLRTQRTNVIGVVFPHTFRNVFAAGDPHYFATLIQGIAVTAQQRDYAPVLWIGYSNEAADSFYRRICQNRLMDGLIIIASVATEYRLVDNLLDIGLPFVMIGRPTKYADQINYVNVDNQQAGRQAVQHLLKLGRRHVATLTGDLANADGFDRLNGYRDMLQSAGIPIDERLIISGAFSRDSGYLGMQQLLRQGLPIDGLFAGSDIIALGAIQAIQEAGLRVPEDISVIGFDDLPMAQTSEPPLTTMYQPISQKAETAAALLLDLIEGKVTAPARISLPARLVIRDSCGYLRRPE